MQIVAEGKVKRVAKFLTFYTPTPASAWRMFSVVTCSQRFVTIINSSCNGNSNNKTIRRSNNISRNIVAMTATSSVVLVTTVVMVV